MSSAVRRVDIVRVRNGRADRASDDVAVEAPLQIRLNGSPFAVVMRTPGRDVDLVAGFLLSERILHDPDELGAIAYCTDPAADHRENVIEVTLTGASAAALGQLARPRAVAANASCGVCGRQSIDDLAAGCAPLADDTIVPDAIIAALPLRLRERQPGFDQTGGLHAAGLFSTAGELLDVAEDVGRHNAVDKIVGRLVLGDALPARDRVLLVSGRTSFELVQKSWVAGIGCIASVSAPSSLAVELAAAAGIRLIGFVRDDTFNVYTG